MNKNILAGGIGTLLEWAEFSYYAYLIVTLSKLFFSELTPQLALIMGFGTFAISYIARPIGSIIFGYLGDIKGRKIALSHSMLWMGFATFAIGLLPTYNTIGLLASVLLIILRFIQGLAMAGEFTGAAVFLAEHDNNKTYLASSWVSTFSAAGMLLGAGVSIIISLSSMPQWSWRIPFLLGGVGCLVGFYIRRRLLETAIYKEKLALGKLKNNPVLDLIKNHKLPVFKTATLAAFDGVYIYTCNIWWISYVIQHKYFSSVQAHTLATIAQACVVVLTPVMAIIAEYVGGRLLMGAGFISAAVTAFWLFSVSGIFTFNQICIALMFYALANTAVTGVMFKYLCDLFPAEVRYSGQAISWSFAVAIFGGTAPLIAQFTSEYFQTAHAPSIYVILSALIALVANCHRKAV